MSKPLPESLDPKKLVELARAVVQADRFPHLASIDGDQPRLRPVSPVRTDHFTVYVANLRGYHKTAEIAANPKVELCYLAPSHDQVRITGVAETVQDQTLLQQIWDANHPRATNTATQTYTYDNLNRLSMVSQPWTTGTADTHYFYDVQDHLSQVTDAEGNSTTYVTSDRDLQTQQASPVSGTTTYAYNEHAQLTSQLDARGITTTRTPDALDRDRHLPDGCVNRRRRRDASCRGRLSGCASRDQRT